MAYAVVPAFLWAVASGGVEVPGSLELFQGLALRVGFAYVGCALVGLFAGLKLGCVRRWAT
jgi:hypothetical protein